MSGAGGRPGPASAESWQGYRFLADNAIDIVLEADLHTTILWISPSVEEVLGWQPNDLIGTNAPSIVHPDDIGEIMTLAQAISDQAARVRAARCRMKTSDGRYRSMQLRGRPALGPDGTVVGHIITMQDTSERDTALSGLEMLSECNRVLARSDSESDLLVQMCETVVKTGHYLFAWYGRRMDDAEKSVEAVAVAGPSGIDTTGLAVSWGDGPLAQGPSGQCLRTGTTQVRHDFDPDGAPSAWADAARAGGFRSAIALPVFLNGDLDGALIVYSDEAGAFDPRTQDLLETLVSDLGLGLGRFAAARRLAESEAQYRMLAENASDVVWQVAPDGTLAWVSESVTRVLGWPRLDVVGRQYTDLIHPDDRAAAVQRHQEHLFGHTTHGEFRLIGRDGSTRWMLGETRPVVADGSVRCITTMRDIEDEMRARHELEHAMGHDVVTGLPTRQTMINRISDALEAAAGPAEVAVLCIGVDSLRPINDAYTHAAGDVVLTTVAGRIATAVGDPDHIGRGAGDEFVVLVHGESSTPETAVELAESIRASVKAPLSVHGETVSVTVSIGIATGPAGTDPSRLLTDASLALRQAKEQGRDRCAFVDADLAARAQRRLVIEGEIRAGLSAGEFEPWFQPVVDLGTAELVGYEALVRWIRGDDIVGPDLFLPQAEHTSLIIDLDRHILERSVAALAGLPEALFVSVNVSSATLTRSTYADHVSELLTRFDVDPARLHLEVTETSLLSLSVQVVDVIRRIADLGVEWYVDDFGTGYSSITHLRDLPVRGLKLDTSFTAGIGRGDLTSRRLAQALAGLAEGLELRTVAEGVETQGEASLLVLQGWQYGQGWLYGKAAPLP